MEIVCGTVPDMIVLPSHISQSLHDTSTLTLQYNSENDNNPLQQNNNTETLSHSQFICALGAYLRQLVHFEQ